MRAPLWDEYEIFDPQVDRPLAEVTPAEARAHYALVMETKDQRVEELKKLARAARIDLDDSEEALQRFNDWFVMYVRADPDRPEQARGRWLSVCHDLSLHLADLILARHPHLHWKLQKTGKTNLSYQRPVLVGFRSAHPTYAVDLYFALTQYAGCIVRREQEERDFFGQLLCWPDTVA
jgi:hypothetical protein